MAKASKEINYRQIKDELDETMLRLQQNELDIDDVIELYKKGLKLIEQLEKYLSTAKNEIQRLKSPPDKG